MAIIAHILLACISMFAALLLAHEAFVVMPAWHALPLLVLAVGGAALSVAILEDIEL
jgi:hypothetical protein